MLDTKSPPCASYMQNCNGVCFDKNSECPVNDIKIIPNSQASDYNNSIPVGSSHKLVWRNDVTGKLPVTDVKLSIDEPCAFSYVE